MAKILGIDYGTKKIGLAIAEVGGEIAVPYEVIETDSEDFAINRIKEICEQEDVNEIVVGVPFSMAPQDGKNSDTRQRAISNDLHNPQSKEVLDFVKKLQLSVGVCVYQEDERLSTKAAAALLKQGTKKKIKQDDDIAAMLILQGYLDRKKKII